MKIYLMFLLFVFSSYVFPQCKDSDDYFSIGIYAGSYIGKGFLGEKNNILNSTAIEFEYFKLKDVSIYLKGLYEFTQYRTRSVFLEAPATYRLAVSFGGRYYLRDKDIRPFLQLGIDHQSDYIGNYSFLSESNLTHAAAQSGNFYDFKLSVNAGLGLNIKLSRKFNLDMQYDLYKNIQKEEEHTFQAFSFVAGVKYIL